jgi:hypothetical protein
MYCASNHKSLFSLLIAIKKLKVVLLDAGSSPTCINRSLRPPFGLGHATGNNAKPKICSLKINVGDPDPDTHVFGHPGSGSISQSY